MDNIQFEYERSVGEEFIRWYNDKHKTSFTYFDRPNDIPDLIYRDGNSKLNIEVGSAYYDYNDAKM